MSYLVTLRCTDCHHKYKRVLKSEDDANPPCPQCKKKHKNIGLDVSAGRAPGIGGGLVVKAMDDTMNMVARDYGMTNLNTDAREGATMAPKLAPAQQAMADAMFNPAKRSAIPGFSRRMNQLGAAAMSGAFAQPAGRDPVALVHQAQTRVPVTFVNKQ